MAEFTSLNGYQVKDTVARSIAKGRNQAVAFTDYATMVEALNGYEKDEYKAGQNVYIGVVGVPDLWVYSVEDIRHTFIYESDDDIVDKLKNNTTVQVGFFKLAMLEGQKVDLTTYDQHLAKHDEDIEKNATDIGELNSSLGNINVYVGSDKKIHFVDKDGADSVLPFNNLNGQLGVGACSSWTTHSNTYKTATLPAGTYLCGTSIVGNPKTYGYIASASITVNGTTVCSCSSDTEGNNVSGSGGGTSRHSYLTYKITAPSTVSADVVIRNGNGAAFCFRIGD